MPLTRELPGAGTPPLDVYLLHGWGMHSGLWGTLPERLRADGCRTHPVELPGHGDSPVRQQMGLSDMIEAVTEHMDAPGYLIGWSLGGVIALEIAHAFPERVTGLALTGVSPCFVSRPDWPHAMTPETFADFRTRVQTAPARALNWFLGLQVRNSANERETLRELRRLLATEAATADTRALLAGLDILESDDLRPRLADIAVPVTIIHGRRDDLVPVAAAEALASGMPDARLTVIDDAGHAAFLSHAEAFYKALWGNSDA